MPKSKELIPPCPDRWSVVTIQVDPKQQRHELRFGPACHLKKSGDHGLEVLREMAKFMNSREMKPRRAIECAADAPNPQRYLAKLAAAL